MKKVICWMVFCSLFIACTNQVSQPTVVIQQATTPSPRIEHITTPTAPSPRVEHTTTPTIPFSQIVMDLSNQQTVNIEEKWRALYSMDTQVVDNGLSLYVEETKPECHKDLRPNRHREPIEVRFIFTNLSLQSITISDRFKFGPYNASLYTGADFSTVFFFANGERFYAEGDGFFPDFDPGPNSFTEIAGKKTYEIKLNVRIPTNITRNGETSYIEIPPGQYLLKFIYWSTQIDRAREGIGAREVARAISSNAIVICIE